MLAVVDEAIQDRAAAAISDALAPYVTPDGVRIGTRLLARNGRSALSPGPLRRQVLLPVGSRQRRARPGLCPARDVARDDEQREACDDDRERER